MVVLRQVWEKSEFVTRGPSKLAKQPNNRKTVAHIINPGKITRFVHATDLAWHAVLRDNQNQSESRSCCVAVQVACSSALQPNTISITSMLCCSYVTALLHCNQIRSQSRPCCVAAMSLLFCATTKYDLDHVHVVLQLCHRSSALQPNTISITSMLCCSYVTALCATTKFWSQSRPCCVAAMSPLFCATTCCPRMICG